MRDEQGVGLRRAARPESLHPDVKVELSYARMSFAPSARVRRGSQDEPDVTVSGPAQLLGLRCRRGSQQVTRSLSSACPARRVRRHGRGGGSVVLSVEAGRHLRTRGTRTRSSRTGWSAARMRPGRLRWRPRPTGRLRVEPALGLDVGQGVQAGLHGDPQLGAAHPRGGALPPPWPCDRAHGQPLRPAPPRRRGLRADGLGGRRSPARAAVVLRSSSACAAAEPVP